MSASPVLTSVQDGIGTITLNRPEARNALNQAMRPALAAAIAQVRDDPAVHAVILTGAGGTFCSGMDLKGFLRGERPSVEGRGFARTWARSSQSAQASDDPPRQHRGCVSAGVECVLARYG